MGYRKISHHLNERGIKTSRGNEWKNTTVFSVLKGYRQREHRIGNVKTQEYGVEIGLLPLSGPPLNGGRPKGTYRDWKKDK
jgi:hypothetical protein